MGRETGELLLTRRWAIVEQSAVCQLSHFFHNTYITDIIKLRPSDCNDTLKDQWQIANVRLLPTMLCAIEGCEQAVRKVTNIANSESLLTLKY